MKINYQSSDISEQTLSDFAKFIGWDGITGTFQDFIVAKYSKILQADFISFESQSAMSSFNASQEAAQASFDSSISSVTEAVRGMFTLTVQ
jgi:hypothetical protein